MIDFERIDAGIQGHDDFIDWDTVQELARAARILKAIVDSDACFIRMSSGDTCRVCHGESDYDSGLMHETGCAANAAVWWVRENVKP